MHLFSLRYKAFMATGAINTNSRVAINTPFGGTGALRALTND